MCTRGYMQLCFDFKTSDLLMTPHAVNTVQFKVNGIDPYTVQYGNGIIAYRPTAALIGYATPICAEYRLSRACQ